MHWIRILLIAAIAGAAGAHAQHAEKAAAASLPDAPAPAWFMGESEIAAGAMETQQAAAPVADRVAALPPDAEDESSRAESDGTADESSPYVPLDSWVYAAFDRLTATGYAPTASETVRPWTRLECARLLAEAHADENEPDQVAWPILRALDEEFAYETDVIDGKASREALLEGVYSRVTGISGTPLRDSYHFGQTIVDDFGRPYGSGANEVSGLSGWASARAFSFYFRGEHQYGQPTALYSPDVQSAISAADSTYLQGQIPFGWSVSLGTTDRLRPVEAYGSANIGNWQISFGQQALWWGPDRTTSLILSNNAGALPMLRLARVKPIKMPGILAWVGPLHFDSFFARQGGIQYVALGPTFIVHGNPGQALTPPPYLWGVNFSIKPSKYFELGFAHTVIFAGYGRPLNLKTFLHTFSILGNGQAVDPGKRVTEFNLTYHVPWLRNNLVAYTEAMAWDDPAEGKFIARFAMDPGLYLPRVPGIKKADLRLEGVYTDLPKLGDWAYFYSNAHYPQGYTNYGQIMGSWIGRQGRGGQAVGRYWLTARNNVALSYRKMTVDKSYLEGGNMDDLSVSASWLFHSNLELSATEQYERWHFPLLGANTQPDFTSMIELRCSPKLSFHAAH